MARRYELLATQNLADRERVRRHAIDHTDSNMADHPQGTRSPPRDVWDKIQVMGIAVGAVALPIVVAFIGNSFSSATKEKEIKLKTVEIAVDILSQDPNTNSHLPYLREWALKVVDQYSGIPLSEEARRELMNNALPGDPAMRPILQNEWGGFYAESHVDDYKVFWDNTDYTNELEITTSRRPIITKLKSFELRFVINGREYPLVIPIHLGRLTKIVIEDNGVHFEDPEIPK